MHTSEGKKRTKNYCVVILISFQQEKNLNGQMGRSSRGADMDKDKDEIDVSLHLFIQSFIPFPLYFFF